MTWWIAGTTGGHGSDGRQIYGLRATCCDRGDGTDQTPAVPSETRGVLSARRGFVVDLRVAQGLLGNGRAIWRRLLARLLGCCRVGCTVEWVPVYEHPAAVDVSHVQIARVVEHRRVGH